MLTIKPVAVIRPALLAILMSTGFAVAQAAAPFHLVKNAQGQILPFKAVAVPLREFVREYSRLTSTVVTTDAEWDKVLNGSVTLFLRRPLKPEQLTEIFHRVLSDNGYAVVDMPAEMADN